MDNGKTMLQMGTVFKYSPIIRVCIKGIGEMGSIMVKALLIILVGMFMKVIGKWGNARDMEHWCRKILVRMRENGPMVRRMDKAKRFS